MGERRRRGADLEHAILDAAWAELAEHGWEDFTIASVAERCGTAKAVIYRRWDDKVDLVRATLTRGLRAPAEPVASSGDLGEDLLRFLQGMATFLAGPFGAAVRGSLTRPSTAPGGVLSTTDVPSPVADIVAAALARGELERPPSVLAQNLGPALLVHEFTHTGTTPDPGVLSEVVRTVWVPALRASQEPAR